MAAAISMDHTRPFAAVCGHNGGACFEQDNLLFRFDGSLLESAAVPQAKKTKFTKEVPEA